MKRMVNRLYPWLRISLCAFFVVSIGIYVIQTFHWPLVNDSAQLHYVCFLMDHGMAPYRDIMEMNMPGIYLFHAAVMYGLGMGPMAWRLFDLALMAAMSAAMIAIAWPYDWLGGVFAAGVFILYHGRDGAGELGQRDLIIAVLMILAYAFLFHALRKAKSWPMFFFGLCAAMASTIKPTPLPFMLLLLLGTIVVLRCRRRAVLSPTLCAISGLLIPAAIVLAFLLKEHALPAFFDTLHVMLPYYATMRAGFSFVLSTCLSPSLRLMALLILAATIVRRAWHSWEECALLAGICFGVISYFVQGKGFVYHRYPMLAFMLLWGGMQFTLSLRKPGIARILGGTGLAAGVILTCLYVKEAAHRHWNDKYIVGLTNDLSALGGRELSGHVQCLDTVAECDTALYRMRLVQSTGLIYDFWVFGPDNRKAIAESRRKFWQELQKNPPRLFIVGTRLYPHIYPDNFPGYKKLDEWPQFSDFLKSNYHLCKDRSFGKGNFGSPLAYRIYIKD